MPSIISFSPGDPLQIIQVPLDGVTYVLRARWNTTEEAWYLDAWERDGTTPIAFGVRLVLGVRLGAAYNHVLFTAGMILLPLTDSGDDPGFKDFGNTVVLVHMTTDDAILSATVN